jgi:hypothetical protein
MYQASAKNNEKIHEKYKNTVSWGWLLLRGNLFSKCDKLCEQIKVTWEIRLSRELFMHALVPLQTACTDTTSLILDAGEFWSHRVGTVV